MLTIPPQWANRPTASQPAHASASPAQLTPERLNALLRSGPRWSASAKPPEPTRPSPAATAPGPALAAAPEAKLTEDLSDLNTALTQDNINQMVRDPDAESSRALIARTRALLTPANMRTMLGGPNASTNAATLEGLRQRLGKQVLTETQQSASNDAEQELIDQMKLHHLENLGKIYDGGLGTDEILKDYNMSRKHIDAMKRDQSAREASVRTLYDIGGSLSKEKLSALRTPEPASATAQVAERLTRQRNTYRFNALSDSRLDAPREISGFMAGDKLDLSGIRNQLNKPLQRVERFSRASAEMQIHYLPSTGTSVIAVSGNPGEPPFVLKVFGQVRYSDIVS